MPPMDWSPASVLAGLHLAPQLAQGPVQRRCFPWPRAKRRRKQANARVDATAKRAQIYSYKTTAKTTNGWRLQDSIFSEGSPSLDP